MSDRVSIIISLFLIVALLVSVFLMAALPSVLTFTIFVSLGILGLLFFIYETINEK